MEKRIYTQEVFEEYERRFAAARLERPLGATREQILAGVKRMLALREDMIPEAHCFEELGRVKTASCTATALRYETWPHVYGAATLYLPREIKERLPLVFICCGHGEEGRRTDGYDAMGRRLASLGMAAIAVDNLGQGDRNGYEEFRSPDHWLSLAPFYGGLTLQGMIVAEMLGLIRTMAKNPRFDPARFGACGNSGGGTLTLFLSALAPELFAIASTGYPSEFGYLMSKERRHCACNLLLGAAHFPDMSDIYGLFAPKPLLLSGGRFDDLIPLEALLRCGRKVAHTYALAGAPENFTCKSTRTRHSWEIADRDLISAFLSRALLGIEPEPETETEGEYDPAVLSVPMPADHLRTEKLAESLSGKTMPEGLELWDIFPPTYKGKRIDPARIIPDLGRGDVMRVWAQMECALTK